MLAAVKNWLVRCQREGRHVRFVRFVVASYQLGRSVVQRIGAPLTLWRIRSVNLGTSVEELVELAHGGLLGTIRPTQIKGEIQQLLEVVREMRPRRILEIGTANGGTLFLFCRVAAEDATIISVDLPGGRFGGGYAKWRVGLFEAFASEGQRLELIRDNSHDSRVRLRVESLLGGECLDFLFIDGDHTYEGVKSDFQMYSPLVKKGGLIAFHDINENLRSSSGGEVPRYWGTIKQKHDAQEFVAMPACGFGIGVLRV